VFIGFGYILLSIFGGTVGYALSMLMRLELSMVGFVNSSSTSYYTLLSIHGLAMIFFLIMPMLIGGFGNLLLPIMLGTNDLIFPRLNALSLYLLYASFSLIFLCILLNGGINCG
jgi:heme/copper-type cytochrome/quinol oxidase subunit 1